MSFKRLLKWVRKTEPEIMESTYRISRDEMIVRGIEFQSKHQADIIRVRNFVEQTIRNPFLKMPYISYAERIAKIRQKYKGHVAVKAATGEALLWKKRGLDDTMLIEIAKLFNLDIAKEYMMAIAGVAIFMTIPHEGVVTVEEVDEPVSLIEFTDNRLQGVEGYVKITPMGENDLVEITEYVILMPEQGFQILNTQTLDVSQLDGNILRFPLKIVRYGYRVTLTSKTYAPREIPVSFNRIIYST